MPQIVLSPERFFSQGDETAMFLWIKEIKGVTRIEGIRGSVVLHVNSSRISDKSLRELIGVFTRYRLRNMQQLAQFESSSNTSWFRDDVKFWHRKVFPPKAKQTRLKK